MIYTKTGDKGYTSLANGKRVSKCTGLLEAYGTADELNAQMGMLRCKVQALHMDALDADLEWMQNKLFNLGASLACAPGEWITEKDVLQFSALKSVRMVSLMMRCRVTTESQPWMLAKVCV